MGSHALPISSLACEVILSDEPVQRADHDRPSSRHHGVENVAERTVHLHRVLHFQRQRRGWPSSNARRVGGHLDAATARGDGGARNNASVAVDSQAIWQVASAKGRRGTTIAHTPAKKMGWHAHELETSDPALRLRLALAVRFFVLCKRH